MCDKISGHRFVVFGIDNEISAHLCMRLALDGGFVFGVGEDAQLLSQIAREVDDVGGRFEWTQETDPACVQSWVEEVAAQHGSIRSAIRMESNRPLPCEHPPDDMIEVMHPVAHNLFPSLPGMDSVRLRLELDDQSVNNTWHQSAAGLNAVRVPANGAVVVADALARLLTLRATGQRELDVHFTPERIRVTARLWDEQGDDIASGSDILFTYDEVPCYNVYVGRTNRGRGVFARRDFCAGDWVLRTTGTVIEFQTEHSIQIDLDRHVEPNPPVRYINHSCDPNLGVRTNEQGFPDFVALRTIATGDELTFDYAMTEFRHYERQDPQLEFSLVCRCGTRRCRGRLGYYSELSDELRQEYADYTSRYLGEISQPGY